MTENSVTELRPGETPAPAPLADTKNYDEIISERPALQRTIGGKTIEFPRFLPAKILLDVRKAEIERKKKGVKESEEDAMWSWGFDLLKDILGQKNFDHIIAHGDLDITMDITMDALEYYGLRSKKDEDEEEGKAQGGEKVGEKAEQSSPSTPSSSTSTPSTPTSSDSTPESGTLSGDATHPTGSEIGDSTSLGSETSPKGALS